MGHGPGTEISLQEAHQRSPRQAAIMHLGDLGHPDDQFMHHFYHDEAEVVENITELTVQFAQHTEEDPFGYVGSKSFPVTVLTVDPGGQADRWGVERGDVVNDIMGRELTKKNWKRLRRLLTTGDPIEVTFLRRTLVRIDDGRFDEAHNPDGYHPDDQWPNYPQDDIDNKSSSGASSPLTPQHLSDLSD